MDELIHCWCNSGCPYDKKENETWQENMCDYYNTNHNTQDFCIIVRLMDFATIEKQEGLHNGEVFKLKTYN